MSYAILYNVFTVWMVALLGLAAVRELQRQPDQSLMWRTYTYFWLAASFLWLLAGLRLLAYFFGWPALDRFFFYGDNIFVALHAFAGAVFLCERLWHRRAVTVAGAAFVGLSMLAFLALLLGLGIQSTLPTAWASEHELPRITFLAFLPGYSLCILLMFYAIMKDLVGRLRAGAWSDKKVALATGGMTLYSAVGIADFRGKWAGWPLLLIRVIYLIAVLAVFWMARAQRPRIEIVRQPKEGT